MSNKPDFTGSMTLTAEGVDFKIEERKTTSGGKIKCVTFPMPNNKFLVETEKGNIYFRFSGWLEEDESKRETYKKTHSLVVDFGEEENKRRKEAGLKNIYIGSMTDWKFKNGERGESAPQQSADIAPPADDEDLPF